VRAWYPPSTRFELSPFLQRPRDSGVSATITISSSKPNSPLTRGKTTRSTPSSSRGRAARGGRSPAQGVAEVGGSSKALLVPAEVDAPRAHCRERGASSISSSMGKSMVQLDSLEEGFGDGLESRYATMSTTTASMRPSLMSQEYPAESGPALGAIPID